MKRHKIVKPRNPETRNELKRQTIASLNDIISPDNDFCNEVYEHYQNTYLYDTSLKYVSSDKASNPHTELFNSTFGNSLVIPAVTNIKNECVHDSDEFEKMILNSLVRETRKTSKRALDLKYTGDLMMLWFRCYNFIIDTFLEKYSDERATYELRNKLQEKAPNVYRSIPISYSTIYTIAQADMNASLKYDKDHEDNMCLATDYMYSAIEQVATQLTMSFVSELYEALYSSLILIYSGEEFDAFINSLTPIILQLKNNTFDVCLQMARDIYSSGVAYFDHN